MIHFALAVPAPLTMFFFTRARQRKHGPWVHSIPFFNCRGVHCHAARPLFGCNPTHPKNSAS